MDLFAKAERYAEMHLARLGGLSPYFTTITEADGTEAVMRGKRVIMLGSNAYLGLNHDPRVKEAAIEATRRFGASTSGSRLLNGNTILHEELQERLARFTGKEAATLYSTGFQTNQGIIAPLAGRGDIIYTDRQVHASIIEGVRLGYAENKKFKHNDIADLERHLANSDPEAGKLVIVDGVYSMEGDICPLDELVALKQRHDFRLLVDDAHGLGVLGAGGRGTAEHFGVEAETDLIMSTFSKSFGSLGGFVAGPKVVIDYLNYNSRSLIFAASMTPAAVGACLKSLEIIETEPERRTQLFRKTARLRAGFKALGFQTIDGDTPVVPILIGDNEKLMLLWDRLMQMGVFANPVISPAVPDGMQLLRNCVMATHTDEQIDRVLAIYEEAARGLDLSSPELAVMHD